MNTETKHILLIYNEKINNCTETAFLNDKSYKVKNIFNAEEAISLIIDAKRNFDLVILETHNDIRTKTITALKNVIEKKNIPVIILFSDENSDLIKITEELNPYGYILNTLNTEIKKSIIDTALRLHGNRLESTSLKNMEILKSVVENSTDAIGMSTPDGKHYYQNTAFDNLFGKVDKHSVKDVYFDWNIGQEIFSSIMKGIPWIGEVKMYAKDRQVHDIFLRAFANKDKNGQILSLVGIHTDITDNKKIEEKLIENEKKYHNQSILLEAVFDSIPDILGVQDIDHSIVKYNKAGYKYLNQKPENCHGKKCFTIIGNDEECEPCATSQVYETKKPARIEKHYPETKTWLDIRAYPVLDEERNLINVIEHIRDISSLKQNEERLNQELIQKEILLKEVHHRIKNNIGAVISFLKLNLSRAQTEEAKKILQESVNQVESIFLIYKNLLISDDYQEISVKAYLDKLISQIHNSFPQKKLIKTKSEIDNIELDVKKLFLFGVIINELFVNSMKYAFPENEGYIIISLKKSKDILILNYSDSGRGLPDNFQIENVTSLGFTLIKMMSQQLNGTLKIDTLKGFNCSISCQI